MLKFMLMYIIEGDVRESIERHMDKNFFKSESILETEMSFSHEKVDVISVSVYCLYMMLNRLSNIC